MNTVIVGLGNPILSDDGVGIQVARKLRERIAGRPGIEVIEAYAGGLRLLDLLTGHQRAIIIDAMETGCEPGTIRRFSPSDLQETRNVSSSHDTSLANAMETGRALGMDVPPEVIVFGIEAAVVDIFSEALSDKVAKAVPDMIETVMEIIGQA
ncbi:MAG: hydrogenase maturation protease [bacterium]|nr:hydrogenase maturation protease [bacterium]